MRFSCQFLSVCIIDEKLQIINLYMDPLSNLQIVVISHGCPPECEFSVGGKNRSDHEQCGMRYR